MESRSPSHHNPSDQAGLLRLAFDATSLLGPVTGVGTFAREVLHRLAARPHVEVTAFAVTARGRRGLLAALPPGVAASRRPLPAKIARAAWLRADRPTVEDLTGPVDVVHGPNFVVPPASGAGEVVTVHDLTALRHPEMCTADVLQWPPLLRRAARRGAWVHCVSEFVADEVREAFPEVGDRVAVVPNGVSRPPEETPRSSAARGRHLAGSDRYVLAVGTVEPRKDLATLVRSFDAVAAEHPDLRLVLAGPDGWGAADLTAAIDAARHRRRVVRFGWVDDDTRYALMRGASVVAYASRYEGFGLVPLDAMSVATPVVATRAGAVPEVVGDAARLVPVGDVGSLAGAIDEVLADDALRERLVAAGLERVERFGWDRTVDGLAEVYERARDERR
ncbi:MAG: glycosyltransferase family 4 protein [Acidimicrobiales bacterium]|nr:glycosyltransferase family 4 protein [Acidimicrobiales bacterium]